MISGTVNGIDDLSGYTCHFVAKKKLSLSQLTFPHQMVRTILLEQIYRSITIIQKKNYHY